MTSARVRRRRADPDIVPEVPLPTKFGEQVSTDTFIIARSSHDPARDGFSGVFLTYPLKQKTADRLKEVLLHFTPKQLGDTTVCKGDNANESLKAVRELGWVPDPSLENRFPHNSAHERDTRTWAEILRAEFLGSGLHIFPKVWPEVVRYAGVAFSITAHPPIHDSERGTQSEVDKKNTTRWALATGGEFPGVCAALGQLCFYRVISADKM